MLRYAITRIPCADYCMGITTANLGKPDIDLALLQHRLYIDTLQRCGLNVKVLGADEAFPDSCFVEDTAVILDEAAIISRPGAPTRRGEVKSMQPELEQYRKLEFIEAPGNLEGGDVMQVNKHFFIGITARTNESGAGQLGAILEKYGYTFSLIPITAALHLKSVVNYIGNNNLLASAEMAFHPEFLNFNILTVHQEDLYAANCLYINDQLIMPKGFERVRKTLQKAGYSPLEINMSEFEKMDGGLTCLSLRFR
ncbi:MAG TPA: arginine deiminase family protein [Chitinophagales bacterium]|nr:arginine deiminase family protein [Chitinophagales bacterium]